MDRSQVGLVLLGIGSLACLSIGIYGGGVTQIAPETGLVAVSSSQADIQTSVVVDEPIEVVVTEPTVEIPSAPRVTDNITGSGSVRASFTVVAQ